MGYARFWLGASLTILALLFAFAMDRVSESASAPEIAISELAGIFILFFAATLSAGLSIIFWHLYHRDDSTLTTIEHQDQEATP